MGRTIRSHASKAVAIGTIVIEGASAGIDIAEDAVFLVRVDASCLRVAAIIGALLAIIAIKLRSSLASSAVAGLMPIAEVEVVARSPFAIVGDNA